ncbi:unnamed protein product [Lymnaea stagnalis]|uniref:MAM domain-containing protein n=1 Tax=Lymnaea stagnalis TaxID=6523 RepID=A0AAV2IGM1_LYMST
MMMWLFFIIFITCQTADGQLVFQYSRHNQELDIRCSVSGLHEQNISQVISLVISKFINGRYEVLTSAVSVGNDVPVVHRLDGAVVTSDVSWSAALTSYIYIHWTTAGRDVAGDYQCSLNGMNNENIPVTVSRLLTVAMRDADPVFVATPLEVDVGLTRNFTVRCSMSDLASLKISQIVSMDIYFIIENLDQHLATIKGISPAQMKPGSGMALVDGFLGGNNKQNFLELSWEHPTLDRAGSYLCDVMAINSSGAVISFSRSINVTAAEPARERLVETIHNLEAALDASAAANHNLESVNANISRELERARAMYSDLTGDLHQAISFSNGSVARLDEICSVHQHLLLGSAEIVGAFQSTNSTKFLNFNNSVATIQNACASNFDYLGVKCDFEASSCGFDQYSNDRFNWIRKMGPGGVANTGPSIDHTPGVSNGYYMVARASGQAPGDNAKLVYTMPVNSYRPTCVSFFYHMYGQTMGGLNVYISYPGAQQGPIWHLQGNQGNSWYGAHVVIPPVPVNSTLIFEAVVGKGVYGDIALDDITISEKQPCAN